MRAVDIIIKKRNHQILTHDEIDFFIQGFSRGEIPDYQAAAWAMAVVLNGMNTQEIGSLTMAMVRSGETIDLSRVVPLAVDKHSTGGVGDKTTLVVEPLVAACGLPVAKMSGRGLGFTGGTLDKMESLPGFRVDLSTQEFLAQLSRIGLVLSGQTANLAPADGKLYALRDVTGTIQSTALIASSIMSKKIAAGAQRIVLDVKVGTGAFMQDLSGAIELAEIMVGIGKETDRETIALISDMNQPLGCAVGNALEVREAITTLKGEGPSDFVGHCLEVSAHMLILGGLADNLDTGRSLADEKLSSGAALDTFRELVIAQGGDPAYVDYPDRLEVAPIIQLITSEKKGYLKTIDAKLIGEASLMLGAGRMKKGESIDHQVGILVQHKVGDPVSIGEPILSIYANQQKKADEAFNFLKSSIKISQSPVGALPLFYGIVTTSGFTPF